MRLKYVVSMFILINFLLASPSYAYIDPNTGGFFFQTVAPFVYAMLGAIVVFWKRIVLFFKGLFGKKENKNSSNDS